MLPATVASVSWSNIGISSFQKSFLNDIQLLSLVISIYKQYTVPVYTHLVSNVMLLLNKITTVQQQDKDMFFFFPLVEVYCVSVCKHSFDGSSQLKRTMCHTSNKIIQPNSLRTHSPRLGQIGSNRKQVIHLFVLRSHENICFIQKLNTVTVCYNFFPV